MTVASTLNQAEMDRVAALLSPPRMAKMLALSGNDLRGALELHEQTLRTGSALMAVIGTLEIVLRNAVCNQLQATFVAPNWLTAPPPPFSWRSAETQLLSKARGQAQKAAYAKLSQHEKRALNSLAYPNGIPTAATHAQQSKARQRAIVITSGDLIAQLTIFFWKRLFSMEYETALWKPSLRKLFPNKGLDRARIAAPLEVIYVARNRLAHHEPIINGRLRRTIEAVEFIAMNLFQRSPSQDAILMKMLRPDLATLADEERNLVDLLARIKPLAPPLS